jgi:hypothetical protein
MKCEDPSQVCRHWEIGKQDLRFCRYYIQLQFVHPQKQTWVDGFAKS